MYIVFLVVFSYIVFVRILLIFVWFEIFVMVYFVFFVVEKCWEVGIVYLFLVIKNIGFRFLIF